MSSTIQEIAVGLPQSTTSDTEFTLDGELPQGWHDWKWQQRNAVASVADLCRHFPGLDEKTKQDIRRNLGQRKITITPYALRLIQRDSTGRAPRADDAIWRQLAPFWETELKTKIDYDGNTENWELPQEMVTEICQHKYDNRVIIRMANVCHSYCQFCYEALRTLEKNTAKSNFRAKHWAETIEYISQNPAIEEVILSGGEPLMLDDARLDEVMTDIRSCGRSIAIRVHTRALTFNPFRITDSLTDIFAKHELAALGLHITHPNEITEQFVHAVRKAQKAVPILFANIPLLNGINNDIHIMRKLCMDLYNVGVIPHYLYHFMPFSPGTAVFRTSVQDGIKIIRAMKRRISNLAVPEFVLPHWSGKYSVPILLTEQETPRWEVNDQGQPIVSYTNWRGERIQYSDIHS